MPYKTTAAWERYWKGRHIDWDQAFGSSEAAYMHPHRLLILKELEKQSFGSVCELGCGGGANLFLIKKVWPRIQVGGVDISPDAIASARKIIPDGIFDARPSYDLFFSNDSVDIVLSDANAIYHDPFHITQLLKEMKRIARKKVILVEFHHKSWFMRQALRFTAGYHAYNYPKRMEQLGFYDIEMKKIPEEAWSGFPWETYGHIITASTPSSV